MVDDWVHDEGPDVWRWLQAWYMAQCDGEWEHSYGVEIGTLDNPGWRVKVDLEATELKSRLFQRHEVHRSEDDWCVTWVDDAAFHAACGPTNLGEALHRFRAWATPQE